MFTQLKNQIITESVKDNQDQAMRIRIGEMSQLKAAEQLKAMKINIYKQNYDNRVKENKTELKGRKKRIKQLEFVEMRMIENLTNTQAQVNEVDKELHRA